ncbi:VIT1/CCC1 transporter family protein [Candidatus Nanohalovita haloferacivicina]|uniref:VIT1/CCC1 transporter family protein n=1 Tax=Candidatus Nanohalovita haloferacivicina TaxID=2978046 RepID=UPI00325F95B1|nr:Putative Fe2 /Mn2 transporter, VIT1/CCC1 family [Candidatus Nanohalobia archaeon BNXNv]
MLEKIREAWKNEDVRKISRRYFISNGFDGTLTSTGVAVGSFLTGVPSGLTVFKVGIGAGIGLATSGVWSVWEIERAEKLAEVHELEGPMMKDLEDTEIHRKKKEGRVVNAAMSGLGPVIGILLPLIPFLFEPVIGMLYSTVASVLVGMMLLGAFGVYMGRLSGQKLYVAAGRMAAAGLVVTLLNVVLPG